MSPPIWIACYLIAGLGHMALWIASFNRLHATNAHYLIRKSSYGLVAIAVFFLPAIIVLFSKRDVDLFPAEFPGSLIAKLPLPFGVYFYVCIAFGLLTAVTWVYRRIVDKQNPNLQIEKSVKRYDFREVAKLSDRNRLEKSLAAIPGNQIYRLNVETRTIRFPHLNSSLNGLTLTLISDLHFTGNICQSYFEEVIQKANGLESDAIVIGGDIIDREHCLPWIEQTLSKLSARMGIYYVLGNHDRKLKNEGLLRQTLGQIGFQDVADRWTSFDFGGSRIHLAGNEQPWFGGATSVPANPNQFAEGDLRICVTHSPDQWKWGRERGCDLTLAGHTHGGQIRIPLVGPIVSPSYYGVKYASGIFCDKEKVMVVSRGVSGEEPIRFFCPPEIIQIKIQI